MRKLCISNATLASCNLDELEHGHQNHGVSIKAVLSALRELMNPEISEGRLIGFTANLDDPG